MIRKMLYRKIIVATSLLFVLLMLYLIPSNSLVKFRETNINYIYPDDLSVIYLLDDNNYVSRTVASLNNTDIISLAYDMLEILKINGKNESKIPSGFSGVIPSLININSVTFKDGILYIDFSEEFLSIQNNYEEKMLEAIVFTLTGIKGVEKINISVDGKQLNNLPHSGKLLPLFLDRSYGINKQYNLVTTNNIDSYIIYYVNKNNGDNYYIPVTKYINDKSKDKIKVIINELASSYIMETNLSSYLDSRAKLLDYEIDNDIIKLNFSKDIFSDITSNNILEEVIYTISLSIMDNIPVSNVIFMVDNDFICESSNIIN